MWTNAYSADDIGSHIAELRRDQGFTQAEFASILGVTRPTLSSLENGGSVSATLMTRAVVLLGSRFVVVPKSAVVSVTESAVVSVTESARTPGLSDANEPRDE